MVVVQGSEVPYRGAGSHIPAKEGSFRQVEVSGQHLRKVANRQL